MAENGQHTAPTCSERERDREPPSCTLGSHRQALGSPTHTSESKTEKCLWSLAALAAFAHSLRFDRCQIDRSVGSWPPDHAERVKVGS